MDARPGGEQAVTATASGEPAEQPKRMRHAALAVFALALLVRVPFVLSPGFPADQAQFIAWSERAHSSGLASVYAQRSDGGGKRFCNYPPGYIYVLWSLGAAYDRLSPPDEMPDAPIWQAVWEGRDTAETRLVIGLHKLPAVLADGLLGALLVGWLAPRVGRRWAAIVGAAYVLMPVVLHNSASWGQVDAIHTFLMVASLEAARRGRVRWMVVLAMLALLTKAQAIVLLPIWTVVAVREGGADWRRRLATAALAALVAAVVLLPFVGALEGVWDAYADAANYYPYTHLNGFSAWFLGCPLERPHLGEPLELNYARDDASGLLGMTPRTWGLAGVLALWVVTAGVLWRRRGSESSLRWATRVLPLGFFVLATQMHERYIFPAIALWVWAFVPTRRWWTCWLVLGAAAAINQMWAWPGPPSAAWAAYLEELLHRSWLGAPPGVWCAFVFTGLLFVALSDRFFWRHPPSDNNRSRANH